MNDAPILSVRNLTTQLKLAEGTYTVVDGLNFDLYRGKTLALVGESGCGKSMTALSLLRIVPQPPVLLPQGKVLYRGKNLLTLPEKKLIEIRGDRIAMIFQDPMSALNPVYTIGFQLAEVVQLHLDLWGEQAEERIVSALREVQIDRPEQIIDSYPHQLSGGMKQRVMIAMALLCEPDVLIADEPTTALDVTVQRQVLDLIRSLQKSHGMAVLLITHDMGVVAEMADDVIVMYATQSVESGSVFSIFDHRMHPYTKGLFQSLPSVKDRVAEKLTSIPGSVPALSDLPLGCYFADRCSEVMPICTKAPTPVFVAGTEHSVRCWLADPEKQPMPEEKPVKKTRRRYRRIKRIT